MDWSLFERISIVDLTHPLSPAAPVFPRDAPVRVEEHVDEGSAAPWCSLQLSMSDHAGTHMDAPRHFLGDGRSVDRIPVRDMVLPAVCIDLRERRWDRISLSGTGLAPWPTVNLRTPRTSR